MSQIESQIPQPGQVGSSTNDNDPMSVNSRVFVGGLNTMEMKKEDVEQIFKRYGLISGISMHKGYAFIQYGNPTEARQAVQGEDQRMYANQALDCNIVNEPKQRPKKKKFTKTDEGPRNNNIGIKTTDTENEEITPSTPSLPSSDKMNNYDIPDILICGQCKEHFAGIEEMADHKKNKCELKRNCKCQEFLKSPATMMCATCNKMYDNSWNLIVHCQLEHRLTISATSSSSIEG